MARIFYLYDANCGWCYAFSPVMREAYDLYGGRIPFEAISGGMVLGEREGPIGQMSDYILNAIPRVEAFSGIRFGLPYVEMIREGKRFNSSLPPSVALTAFKHFLPERSVEFAEAIQQAAFVKGEDLNSDATYMELVKAFPVDETAYRLTLQSEAAKTRTLEEFHFTGHLGVTGFPTVIGQQGSDYFLLARGFMKREEFIQQLDHFLKGH